jgi:uncharacterized membrane protein YesL
MDGLASPVLAGAAFALLCAGVVTWLPALAALAQVMRAWRQDGESRCFAAVFAAFPAQWRALRLDGIAATAVLAMLLANTVFLAGRPSAAGILLLALQLGLLAGFVPYVLALAVVTSSATASQVSSATRRREAFDFAFGAPGRGLALLAICVALPLASLPLVLGPVLLAPSLSVLFALPLHDRWRNRRS